jgi:hypothetical protein
MLDPWIIEQIRRREEEQRDERPRLELPLPDPSQYPGYSPNRAAEEESGIERGVAIIQIG